MGSPNQYSCFLWCKYYFNFPIDETESTFLLESILLANALNMHLVNGCYRQTINKTWLSQKHVAFWKLFWAHLPNSVHYLQHVWLHRHQHIHFTAPFVNTQTPVCKLSTHIFICASNTSKNKRSVGKLCTTT